MDLFVFLSRILFLIFQESFKVFNFNEIKSNKININLKINKKMIIFTFFTIILGIIFSQFENLKFIGYSFFFLGLHLIIHIFHQFITFKTGIILIFLMKILESLNFK